jgi:hypothetical protein
MDHGLRRSQHRELGRIVHQARCSLCILTAPVAGDGEIRTFLRDPDGHLLEISQVQ